MSTKKENNTLIEERKIADHIYAIELCNFHHSLEKVIREISDSIWRDSHKVFQMKELPSDIAVLIPIGHTSIKNNNDEWLCISKDTSFNYKVTRIQKSSLVNVIPSEKRAVVLIDYPYEKAMFKG